MCMPVWTCASGMPCEHNALYIFLHLLMLSNYCCWQRQTIMLWCPFLCHYHWCVQKDLYNKIVSSIYEKTVVLMDLKRQNFYHRPSDLFHSLFGLIRCGTILNKVDACTILTLNIDISFHFLKMPLQGCRMCIGCVRSNGKQKS